MQTEVSFRSGRFRPLLPEECQVNPGRYGAELAFWLCVELAKVGVATSYPNFEDWGWFLEYITQAGDEFWLCCGNVEGSDDRWTCFLEPKGTGFLGRRKPGLEAAKPLLDGLADVLAAESSISDVEWSEPPG
jgi:hypothetical protein